MPNEELQPGTTPPSQPVHMTVPSRRSIVSLMDGKFFTHGGRRPTGLEVVEWARKNGTIWCRREILLTSMDKDGTKDGFDLELTAAVSEAVSIPVIASGGAGTLEHLREGFSSGKADAVLAASIFHYRTYTIQEAKQYLLGSMALR